MPQPAGWSALTTNLTLSQRPRLLQRDDALLRIYEGAVENVTQIIHAVRTLARLGRAAKSDLAEREGKHLPALMLRRGGGR